MLISKPCSTSGQTLRNMYIYIYLFIFTFINLIDLPSNAIFYGKVLIGVETSVVASLVQNNEKTNLWSISWFVEDSGTYSMLGQNPGFCLLPKQTSKEEIK